MKKNNNIRYGKHSAYLLHVHLVFITKYRRKVFTTEILNDLHSIFSNICCNFEAELSEFNRKKNYPHVRQKLWGGPLWSLLAISGSCEGAPIDVIRQHIEKQQGPSS